MSLLNHSFRQWQRDCTRLTGTLATTGLLLCSVIASPVTGADDVNVLEEASAKNTPWSGYWWPHRQGAMLAPLTNYDHLTGAGAVAWEREHHPSGPATPEWFGYCHAWAASSVLEAEPTSAHMARFQQRKKRLQVGDQKGLLAVSHAMDVANSYGDRYGDGHGSDDLQDLTPDSLWRLLKLYVKQQRVALILDIEASEEVWNYPVYAYRIVQTGELENGMRSAELGLWMADNSVAPNHVGLKPKYQSYEFQFRMRNGSIVMGSGKWTGRSVKDHPDFAWYPYIARSENPEVQYPIVRELIGLDAQTTEPVNPDLQPNTNNNTEPEEPATLDGGSGSDAAGGSPMLTRVDPQTALLGPAQLAALVAGRKSNFALDADTEPFGIRRYSEGDPISLRFASERDGFLYLLHVSPKGELTQVYPQPGMDNRIPGGADSVVVLPNDKVPFDLRAIGPHGTHRIKVFVTTKQLRLSGLQADFDQQQQQQGQQQQNAGQASQRQTRPDQATPAQSQNAALDQSKALYVEFRWHPTQRQQLQQLIMQSLDNGEVPEQLQSIDLKTVLGEFAQDEVIYQVVPEKRAGRQ